MGFKRSSALICLLATLFVTLQLVAPPGMMPRAGTDGFEITICTAQGFETIFVETQNDEEETQTRNSDFCVFSVVMLKLPASGIPFSFNTLSAKLQYKHTSNEVVLYSVPCRSNPPRAPPSFVAFS